jgi:hypothetical protein
MEMHEESKYPVCLFSNSEIIFSLSPRLTNLSIGSQREKSEEQEGRVAFSTNRAQAAISLGAEKQAKAED